MNNKKNRISFLVMAVLIALTYSLPALATPDGSQTDIAPDIPKADSTIPVEIRAENTADSTRESSLSYQNQSAAATQEAAVASQPSGAPAGIVSEIANATVSIKQLPVPIVNISGKARWVEKGTEISDVKFQILDSRFSTNGFIGKGDAPHNFTVVSDSVKFDDLKKIYPVLSGFNMTGDFKFNCNVSGKHDDPRLDGKISLPSSKFDFGELLPELKGISISDVRSGFYYSKEKYEVRDFTFNAMGGSVKLGGAFSPGNRDSASLSIAVTGVDASQIARFSPKLKGKITGGFSANFKIVNVMRKSDATAEGTLYFTNGTIRDLESLKKLGEKIKAAGLSELNYSKIGGNFKLHSNKRVDFSDFVIVSDVVRLKSSGTIDENKNISAKALVEISGEKLGGKMGDSKLGKLLNKVVKKISANFNVTGTTDQPKFDIEM